MPAEMYDCFRALGGTVTPVRRRASSRSAPDMPGIAMSVRMTSGWKIGTNAECVGAARGGGRLVGPSEEAQHLIEGVVDDQDAASHSHHNVCHDSHAPASLPARLRGPGGHCGPGGQQASRRLILARWVGQRQAFGTESITVEERQLVGLGLNQHRGERSP